MEPASLNSASYKGLLTGDTSSGGLGRCMQLGSSLKQSLAGTEVQSSIGTTFLREGLHFRYAAHGRSLGNGFIYLRILNAP